MEAESQLLLVNFVLVLVTYQFVYPRFAGRDMNKLFLNDLAAMVIALLVAGSLFSGSRAEFSLVFTTTNWFWFSLVTYLIIETPFAVHYLKKYNVLE